MWKVGALVLHKFLTRDVVHADCMAVTSEEGEFFYKAVEDGAAVCGVYFITDPDRRVEVHFGYLDVPCQDGGLVSVSNDTGAECCVPNGR